MARSQKTVFNPIRTSFYVSGDDLQQIIELGSRQGLSRNVLLRTAVANFLQQQNAA